jgi:hypothetical protein
MCTGKDCRQANGFRTVQRELGRACSVVDMPCLEVCDGPVVVIEPRSSDSVILERVGTRALALEVVDHVIDREPLSGRLRKRRLSGAKREKARRRVVRAL